MVNEQDIYLTGSDEQNSFRVGEGDVVIHASTNSTEGRVVEASNKVKIAPIVRFDWDKRAYFGRVIAVHKNGDYIAYSLKPATSPGGGAVRVIYRSATEPPIKHLMKGFNGRVVDLDFACRDLPTLACVDETGLIMVYTIHLTAEKVLEAIRILQVVPNALSARSSEMRRVRWCPYVPGPDAEGSSWLESLLAASHGAKLELYDVDVLSQKHGHATIKSELLKTGYLSIEEHLKAITEISPSPDGFAIATASLDGSVNFYELPEQLQSQCVMNRMYHWIPHKGEPVNSLIFLDDRRPGKKTNLWCNVLTGAQDNRELCIWSCDRWEMIQRLALRPASEAGPDDPAGRSGQFFVRADLSGRLIVASDVTRSVLYVFELDGAGGSDSPVHCRGVHEFVLASACLDLAVMRVIQSEKEPTDGMISNAIEIEAAGIYPKSLQSLQMHFNSVLTSRRKSLSNGDVGDLEELASSLTAVSPVSSMLTGLGASGVAPLSAGLGLDLRASGEAAEDNGKSSTASIAGSSAVPAESALSSEEAEAEEEEAEETEADQTVLLAPVGGDEWPAAPELPVSVSESLTASSSCGPSSNVAVVAPRESARDEDEEEEEEEEVVEEDEDTPGADGEEEEDAEDEEDANEEDEEGEEVILEEEGATENGGYAEDDEDECDDDATAALVTDAVLDAAAVVEVAPCSASPAPLGPPAWAVAIAAQLQRQSEQLSAAQAEPRALAEQLAALQRHLVAERAERARLQEAVTRLEAGLGHVAEGTAANASSARAHATANGEAVASQLASMRRGIEQKLSEQQRTLLVQQEQLFKSMVTEVSTKVFQSLVSNVNAMLSNEIASVVLPNVRKCVEETRCQLNASLQEKLVAIDAVIRDHINKVFKNKATMDMIARGTADVLRRSVTAAVDEQTRTVLMPEVSSALNHNASRLRELLRKNAEEMQAGIASHATQSEQDRREHLESVLQENKRAIDKQLTASLRHLETSLEGHMSRLSQNVGASMAGVSEELRAAMAANQGPTAAGDFCLNSPDPRRSGAVTPQPAELTTAMLRKQMMSHLSNERYQDALHEVLTHKRPELLSEFTRMVPPASLFASNLPQNVLLSLLSQLTNTLHKETGNKVKYIMEAVVHLDRSDRAFKTYGPQALAALNKKVEAFLRENPRSDCTTEMQLLRLALSRG